MAVYIYQFAFYEYKGVSNLLLNDLKDVNILTGDNDTGKTSALEILHLYSDADQLNKLIYGSKSVAEPNQRDNLFEYEKLKHVFSAGGNDRFAYVFALKNFLVELSVHKKEIKKTISRKEFHDLAKKNAVHFKEEGSPQDMVTIEMMKLEFLINGKCCNRLEFYKDFLNKFEERTSCFRPQYVSLENYEDRLHQLENIFEDEDPHVQEEVVHILKEIDSDILYIFYDEKHDTNEYKVSLKGYEQAIPLACCGTGIKKAMVLIDAVIHAKKGFLLIDDLETFLNDNAMLTLFSWIITACMEWKIQLFLSTHSNEVIETICKVCPEYKEHIMLHTLYKEKDKIAVRSISSEEAMKIYENYGLALK